MDKSEITNRRKVALGGGCHWCTEAIFQALKGVVAVEQGFVASSGNNISFSEAVIVHFDTRIIGLKDLIEIHLYTHESTSNHSFREKYRSAIYTYCDEQYQEAKRILAELQTGFEHYIITSVCPFKRFKPSKEEYTNYYFSNPKKPFCQKYITPKLKLLLEKFPVKLAKENLELISTN